MQALLITRPQYDKTTYYLFHWSKPVISAANEIRLKVIDLDRDRATRKELSSVIKKINPNLILFNGHGSRSSILGHGNEMLIQAGYNETLLKGTIVYALSCGSGKELGLKSIKSGALTFMGYKEDFVFWINERFSSRPLNDPRAELFLEASNQIALSLLKGKTTSEALEKAKDKFLRNVQSLLSSNSEDRFLIPYLIWDMQNLVLLGNHTATI